MNRAEQILHVAHELLLERGYNGFSYADISKTIGIQKASIHYHFPSKDNLIASVVHRYRREVKSKLALLDSSVSQPFMKLEHYLAYWDACLQNKPIDICLCAQLASEIPVLPEEVRHEVLAHFQEITNWIANILREAAANRLLQPTIQDLDQEAAAILAGIHGGMLAARATNDGKQFQITTALMLNKIKR